MRMKEVLGKIIAIVLSICLISGLAGSLAGGESQAATLGGIPSAESSIVLKEQPLGFMAGEYKEESQEQMAEPVLMELAVEQVEDTIVLTWKDPQADHSYKVCRSFEKTGTFVQIGQVEGGEEMVSFVDEEPVLGKTHYYKVLQYQNDRLTAESDLEYCIPKLQAPVLTGIVQKGTNGAKISWEQVEQADAYEIYRSYSKDSGYVKIAKVEGPVDAYTNAGLAYGRAHYYKVKACFDAEPVADSSLSEPLAYYMKPVAPVVNGEAQKSQIRLSWARPTGGESFTIYRANDSGTFVKLGTTTGLSYYDKNVKAGKEYRYKITASYKKDGKTITSDYSAVCKVFASGIDPNKPMVALTFDDGPGPYTQAIIDCLEEHNARATFFVLGERVSAYKDEVKAAHAIGCDIGNHSWSHPQLSTSNVSTQIGKTDDAVKKVTGEITKLYRAPYGATGSAILKRVAKPHIYWSVDTLDWKTKSKQATIDHVLSHVRDGDIILMHDIHKPTMQATLVLIPELQRRGYQLVTVSELAKYKGVTMKNGVTYYNFR